MYVFAVRGDRVLALVNNMYVLERKTKCLHLLHLCVERRVDRVIALIVCVCVGKGDRELAVIYIICVCVCVCRGIYCLHQLIILVLLGMGQALIVSVSGKGRPRSCSY